MTFVGEVILPLNLNYKLTFLIYQFRHSVMSNSLQPHDYYNMPGSVHHQLLNPAQTHVHRVSDAIQPSHSLSSPSFPASGSFPMCQFFASCGQSFGALTTASVLPMNIQDWFPLRWASMVAQLVKNLPAMQETPVQFLGWEDPLEKGIVTHSSILAWRIPWTEEHGRLQSMGSQSDTTEWLSLSLLMDTSSISNRPHSIVDNINVIMILIYKFCTIKK